MGEEFDINEHQILLRNEDGSFTELGSVEKAKITANEVAKNPFKKKLHFVVGEMDLDTKIALLELAFGNGRIRKFISRLGGDWRDKLYKNYE